jgi:hypothetical protein
MSKPFPEAKPEPDRIEEIGITLAEGGETLRQAGHNAIFAMLAIKAFRLMPDAATPLRVPAIKCTRLASLTQGSVRGPTSSCSLLVGSATGSAAAFSRYDLFGSCRNNLVGSGLWKKPAAEVDAEMRHVLNFETALLTPRSPAHTSGAVLWAA